MGKDEEIGCIPLERMNSVLTAATCYNIGISVQEGNFGLFSDLLRNVDISEINDNIVHLGHNTILHIIAKFGRTEYYAELLRQHRNHVNPNIPHQVLQKFPIHLAAEEGHFEMVEMLLQNGADVNAKMEDGTTPLHILSMRSGANWLTDRPLERQRVQRRFGLATQVVLQWPGLNVDVKNNIGVVPLYFAADTGSDQVLRLLLNHGACVTVEVDDESVEDFINENRPEVLKGLNLEKNRVNKNTIENELFQQAAFICPSKLVRLLDRIFSSNLYLSNNCAASILVQHCVMQSIM